MWPNQFERTFEHKRFISNSGSPFEDISHPVIDKETG